MKTRLFNLWDMIRRGFWFLPGVMTISSLSLFFFVTTLDEQSASALNNLVTWVYAGDAIGARSVLSTVAGSIITVTGVIFSITVVALTLASSQFGPRVLRNFMRSTTTQLVLGIFIGTFTYCLLALRTIQGEIAQSANMHLSVTIGVVMTVACMMVLIYFIHHVAASIQVDNLIATIYCELERTIDRIFPENGKPSLSAENLKILEKLSEQVPGEMVAIQDGYLQAIDNERLTKFACEQGLFIKSLYCPGDFIVKGSALAQIWYADKKSEQLEEKINAFFIQGHQRTPEQDIEFTINQLVEVAIRALSPGINDPFTALSCIEYLSAALCQLAAREFPSIYCYDEMKLLRVIHKETTFTHLVNISFDPIRQYGQSSPIIVNGLLKSLQAMIAHVENNEDYLRVINDMARGIVDAFNEVVSVEQDKQRINKQYQIVSNIIQNKIG